MLQLGFNDPQFEVWAQRALMNIAEGGCELGEVLSLAPRIPAGDTDIWYREWCALANRLYEQAGECRNKGHLISARQLYQRAATYYRTSYPLLFGAPTDPRVLEAYRNEARTFHCATQLFSPPIEVQTMPFENTTLPGYFYSGGHGKRPLLICTNGYDDTLHTMHYAHAVSAQRRGYHVLTFDGPGQGAPLIEHGLTLRPDWENVVGAVLDHILTRPDIDASKVALTGWSFGGFLAPRAAAGEPRIKALIADPGQWDMTAAIAGMLKRMGAEDLVAALPNVPEEANAPIMQAIEHNPALKWTLVQRGFWVHGVSSFTEYVKALAEFTVSDCVHQIQCPAFITQAENDPIAGAADVLFNAIEAPKTFKRFTAQEGAGDHCEAMARSVYHQHAYDWLDTLFKD
ncbi:alpha/beta fold hydrolase [Pusillimonas sp. DMV24BSW_D]|uniref:alpha/beta hydrolase family protein n=1 Tax=Neopusillimonas aestuarii TaxID=2716226 RepID=UPI001408F424|nr:alpha/beta fold hydrolase [Pusillimonas sp. DMV24BSW_D]QIM49426.1 alpha/beta fold hydrolase [Pusillimonas sp. DMV24BSW_D]